MQTGKQAGLLKALQELVVTAFLTVGFVVAFQTAAFATFYIPSESMVPALQVGDRLTASKFAYGYGKFSLPFGVSLPKQIEQVLPERILGREPKRGDIVVFMHPKGNMRMIKRLIGLPGDRIAIERGRLVLNGVVVPRQYVRTYRFREHKGRVVEVREFDERLPGAPSHKIIEHSVRYGHGDMAETTVPSGHYFMMGDNRDNSADSRYAEMGVVPFSNLIARAEAILFSLYSCAEEPGVECADKKFATFIQ